MTDKKTSYKCFSLEQKGQLQIYYVILFSRKMISKSFEFSRRGNVCPGARSWRKRLSKNEERGERGATPRLTFYQERHLNYENIYPLDLLLFVHQILSYKLFIFVANGTHTTAEKHNKIYMVEYSIKDIKKQQLACLQKGFTLSLCPDLA